MIIRTELEATRGVVQLIGRFDAHEAAAFRRAVQPLLTSGRSVIRLDLSQVAFVDSTALAELVRLHKAAHAIGATVVLGELSDPVRVILEITDLAGIFAVDTDARAEQP